MTRGVSPAPCQAGSPARRRRRLPLAAAAAVAVLPLMAACSSEEGSGPRPGASHAWHGVEPVPVQERPAFVLTDTDGKRFDFHEETKGRPTLVYFGYTNCPDECPTAFSAMATALRRAPREVREATRVVFVTTDPQRDTAPVIRRWLDQFSERFIGLRGSAADVEAAQRAAGAAVARKEGPVPTLPGRPDAHPDEEGTASHEHFGPLGYGVGHAAVIFAYDAADRLPVVYPDGVAPADIAADLPALARPALARSEEPT